MIRRPPRSTHCISSAASDVYKRQVSTQSTWVHALRTSLSAGVGGIVQQRLQQMAGGRIGGQPRRQRAGALQFHRRADQLPALHHVVQVDALVHAHVGRGSEGAHAVATQVDELAHGAGVLADVGFGRLLADVLGQQRHRGQRGVQFVRDGRGMRGQRDDALVAGEALAQARQFLLPQAQGGDQPGGEVQHHGRRQHEIHPHGKKKKKKKKKKKNSGVVSQKKKTKTKKTKRKQTRQCSNTKKKKKLTYMKDENDHTEQI
eukprot:TRINITY_DN27138_c0_g1_i1.p2 TRINITY_DN27138_c0_g1~~TRINITY_DN27138_c0_g1_i1.p2  ORF type:complete len:260 (+),score=87.45 TRINITY_DN27138_c0_g1_i1:96-875(+)